MRVPRWPGAAGILDRLDVLLYQDQFRKAAGFLFADVGRKDGITKPKPIGTVAFVRMTVVRLPGCHPQMTYAVTTRHTIEYGPGERLRIRFNGRDGSLLEFSAPRDQWIRHDTEDVAVIPLVGSVTLPSKDGEISDETWDIESIHIDDLLTESQRDRYVPGDGLVTIGLYSHHPGEETIEPILRFGNLSLVPKEPVTMGQFNPDDDEPHREAFLGELQAWRGQSGSPVFAHKDDPEEPGVLSMKLIGLVHGYSRVPVTKDDRSFQWVNEGIAIIVPAYRILETLNM